MIAIASRLDLPQLTPRWLIDWERSAPLQVLPTADPIRAVLFPLAELTHAIAQTGRAIARAPRQKARRLRAARRRRKERRRRRHA